MRKIALVMAAAVVVGTTGCSVKAATNNVATMDAAATKACAELRLVRQDRAALSPVDLRQRIGQINADAQASANPIIKARATALYTDATLMAEGAEAGSFQSDLTALDQTCQPAAH